MRRRLTISEVYDQWQTLNSRHSTPLGLAHSIDAAAHELCFATNARKCTVSELFERLRRVDGRFFCVSRGQFEAALDEGVLDPHSYLREGDTLHVI